MYEYKYENVDGSISGHLIKIFTSEGPDVLSTAKEAFSAYREDILITTEDELKILILTGWGGSLFAQTLK